MKQNSFWDHNATRYFQAKDGFYRSRGDAGRKILCSDLKLNELKKQRILDAGCGAGDDVKYFASFGADIYGVDSSRAMISIAKARFPKLKNNFSIQNLSGMSFTNGYFDVIYSRYAIHCSRNIKLIFDEFSRILKKNGVLLVLVAHPLLGLLSKKTKNYSKKEIYELKIFQKKFLVSSPAHIFSEYLNKNILNKFELIDFIESKSEKQAKENTLSWSVPDFVVLKYKKR